MKLAQRLARSSRSQNRETINDRGGRELILAPQRAISTRLPSVLTGRVGLRSPILLREFCRDHAGTHLETYVA